jgi:2-polyprenyl-3-methyl-5-hydroxy-6-metoxy-1,4-benzoquinol methylase
MSDQQYFATNEKDEVELKRLGFLEQIFDPITIRHFKSIGVSEGWRCLEVAAGAGSIVQWLSGQIGPEGKVVATDMDLRFLRRLKLENLEIRQHNILKDEIEQGVYDIVHCRALLGHLSEPEKAFKRMADAVRPGGWLLVEAQDWASFAAVNNSDPASVSYTSTAHTVLDFLKKRHIMEPYFGRRLRSLIEEKGFTDVRQDGSISIMRGGEPIMRFVLITAQVAVKPMITAGLLKQEEMDNVERLSADSKFYALSPTNFSVWGKKPTI